ncbi:Maltose/maltodextrin ABC transporter, permease protein MalF [Klebsiella pneumoniae IS39]|nr:Maltose/maltodextrin ABC transporter, permease protein MalF [Klebsiella pneumoniae IS39]
MPGFGQFYHRQWLKGLVFLVLLSSFLGIFYDFLREGLWGLYTWVKRYRGITLSSC